MNDAPCDDRAAVDAIPVARTTARASFSTSLVQPAACRRQQVRRAERAVNKLAKAVSAAQDPDEKWRESERKRLKMFAIIIIAAI